MIPAPEQDVYSPAHHRHRKPWAGRVYEAAIAANRPKDHPEPTHRAGRR